MTFSILDYTEKLENIEDKGSWLLADCPVCSAHKFKINATTGAYGCYTNHCSNRKIRDAVARYTPFIKTNLRVAKRATRRYLDAEPMYIPADVLLGLQTHFVRCERKEEVERKYYDYSTHQRTVRFMGRDGKKIVAPQYLKGENYVSGTGSDLWMMFNEQHILNFMPEVEPSITENKYIMMAEGEKCAVSVANQTYECLTPATFCFTPEYMDTAAKKLLLYGIKGVLYFEDNDAAGRKKSHLVSNACWRNGLQCTVINPSFLRSGASADDGFDIADSRYELQDLVYLWVEHNGR